MIDPAFRADAVVATWGLLTFGHLLEGSFGVWALGWGNLGAHEDSTTRTVTVLVIMVLGWTGMALSVAMLRRSLQARTALVRRVPRPATGLAPIIVAGIFVLFAVCVGVTTVLAWQATAVFPAVIVEFMVIPLAMRTEQLLRDAADPS